MSKLGLAGVGLLLAGLASLAQAGGAMPVLELSAGMHRIEAEVAAEDRHRQSGLMYRESMPVQRGMLFVFPQENTHCMWMRNTLIPLSVAFIDGDGYIINIEDMAPNTEDNHCAKMPARYALEMNRGWFARRGIARGTRLRGLDHAPMPR